MSRVGNHECRATCGRRNRIYVAVCNSLNSFEKSVNRPWYGSYIFKVGAGKACWDRETSANGVDIHGRTRNDRQPPYAGATDWETLQCWVAAMPKQDDQLFRPWAVKHIRWVKPDVFDSTKRKRRDLYCLSAEQVALGRWPRTGHEQNDEIVEAAIRGLRLRIDAGLIPDLGRLTTKAKLLG